VDALCEKLGSGREWYDDDSNGFPESTQLKLDCSKAMDVLGWQTYWNLDKTLDAIVSWHHSYEQGADMKAICNAQIDAYVSDINNHKK